MSWIAVAIGGALGSVARHAEYRGPGWRGRRRRLAGFLPGAVTDFRLACQPVALHGRRRPLDSPSRHATLERRGLQTETFGGTPSAADSPLRALEHGADV